MNTRSKWRVVCAGTALLGVLCATGRLWSDALDPLIYDGSGNYIHYGRFPELASMLENASTSLFLSGSTFGVPLLLAGLLGFSFSYLAPGSKPAHMLLLGMAVGASIGLCMLVPGFIEREGLLALLHWPLLSLAAALAGGPQRAYFFAIPIIFGAWTLLGLFGGLLACAFTFRNRS
jgi:hypothetical protein